MAFEPQEVVDYMRQVEAAESENRIEALYDLRFSYGDQWDTATINSRKLEARPCLTINKVDAFIRQVTNSQRQQRPRMKATPMDAISDPKIAEVLTGILRHIQLQSDADNAYDTAFNFAARAGVGYFRILTDYISEQSFDQDIYISQIENPFAVYFDPSSTLPDGSDAERCLITDMISKKEFKRLYGGADDRGFVLTAAGDYDAEGWATKEEVRIAEYFEITKQKQKLVMLSDKTIIWADMLPPPEVLAQAGISIVGDRDSYRQKVDWYKCTSSEILETKPWAGKFIPVVPVYGETIVIDGKKQRFGLVRGARDPQKMYNFWRTAMTESIAMAPKAKWLMAEGQDEGHENEWNRANVSAMAVLRYKMTDVEGREAPAPQRLQPEPPPSGSLEAAEVISNDLQSVLGIFDPAMGKPSGPKSGLAIRAEQGQSEQSNFHLYDNLTRSLKHTGRIILDLVPRIYDTQRVMRIIGDDGKPDLVTINEQGDQQAIGQLLNDVTVGNYDIDMDVGPGYNSKRAEAVDSMMSAISAAPELMHVAGDLIFRNMDFPGADIIADRLAASNPLSQIDEKSDIPPQVQMQIKQMQQQLQQAQQQLQAQEQLIKSRADLEAMREGAETHRTKMKLDTRMREIETLDNTKRHDINSELATKREDLQQVLQIRAHDAALGYKKAIDVENIRAQLAMLLAQMGGDNDDEAKAEAIERAI